MTSVVAVGPIGEWDASSGEADGTSHGPFEVGDWQWVRVSMLDVSGAGASVTLTWSVRATLVDDPMPATVALTVPANGQLDTFVAVQAPFLFVSSSNGGSLAYLARLWPGNYEEPSGGPVPPVNPFPDVDNASVILHGFYANTPGTEVLLFDDALNPWDPSFTSLTAPPPLLGIDYTLPTDTLDIIEDGVWALQLRAFWGDNANTDQPYRVDIRQGDNFGTPTFFPSLPAFGSVYPNGASDAAHFGAGFWGASSLVAMKAGDQLYFPLFLVPPAAQTYQFEFYMQLMRLR